MTSQSFRAVSHPPAPQGGRTRRRTRDDGQSFFFSEQVPKTTASSFKRYGEACKREENHF